MTAYTESAAGLAIPTRTTVVESARPDPLAELYEARIWQLEQQLAEEGWTRLDANAGNEFTRGGLGKIVDLARVNYLKNPLIKRSVEIGALYVWGQDLSVNAADKEVKAVVDRFWQGNRATLTGQQASRLMEVELQVTGNVFLALFPNAITGEVKVRLAPMEEIKQIVSNPDDRADVWYYERRWMAGGITGPSTEQRAYYPHWTYRPDAKPATLQTQEGEFPIRWESPMLHVKAGAFPHWQWGVPEVYAALDWARTYKEQLEDDATRSRALARFAWKATAPDKRGVAVVKSRLNTTFGMGNGYDTNPPPAPGSTAITGPGYDMDPIRVAGATLDPDHSRPARLMAAAATGIPDHFFDPAIGNHATAKTMDRPTELRFNERRQMWRDVLTDLFQWVIDADIAATRGLLAKTVANDEKARKIDLAWPDILQPDTVARITSIATAATDNGNADAGNMPKALKARLYMQELGVDDIDEQLAELEKEQAANEQKAADIQKQMQPKPPVPDPSQPPPKPDPTKATEAKRAKALDLAGALAFFDKVNPDHAGLLGGESA